MPVDGRDPSDTERQAINAMRIPVCTIELDSEDELDGGWHATEESRLAMLRAVPPAVKAQLAIEAGALVKFRRQGLVEGYELRGDRLASENKTPRMMQSVWPKKVGEDTVAMEDVMADEDFDDER